MKVPSTRVRYLTSKENDGTYGELVLRFFAYLNNKGNFDHSVVGFLNDYMSESSKNFNYKKNRKLFEKTFNELSKLLPEGIRRGNRKLTPMNLCEAISVGAAQAIGEGKLINTIKMIEDKSEVAEAVKTHKD